MHRYIAICKIVILVSVQLLIRAVRLLEQLQLLVIVASQSQLCDYLHAIYLKVN